MSNSAGKAGQMKREEITILSLFFRPQIRIWIEPNKWLIVCCDSHLHNSESFLPEWILEKCVVTPKDTEKKLWLIRCEERSRVGD